MALFKPPELLNIHHHINTFDCGEPSLNQWLKRHALRNQMKKASRCFVVCSKDTQTVKAYYTLSAGAIAQQISTKPMRRNMPDPLPVLLLGRLAVDLHAQSQGIGTALLKDALLRALSISNDAGVFALLVHALSSEAKAFYLSHGFVASPIQPMTLMLTLKTAQHILLNG